MVEVVIEVVEMPSRKMIGTKKPEEFRDLKKALDWIGDWLETNLTADQKFRTVAIHFEMFVGP
jgi:hypothetical protein